MTVQECCAVSLSLTNWKNLIQSSLPADKSMGWTMRTYHYASSMFLFLGTSDAFISSPFRMLQTRTSSSKRKTTAARVTDRASSAFTQKKADVSFSRSFDSNGNWILSYRNATYDDKTASDLDDDCCIILGGGGDKLTSHILQEELNLDREKTRLESFEVYVLVSTLTASASFNLVQGFNPQLMDHTVLQYTMYSTTLLVAGLSALCGLHATIVFSLSVLYCKTSLGLKKDGSYDYFLIKTSEQRIRGFKSFSASLLLFATEIALVLLDRVPGNLTPVALALAAVSMTYVISDWKLITESSKIIFMSPEDVFALTANELIPKHVEDGVETKYESWND